MNITLNGKTEPFIKQTKLIELLNNKKLSPDSIIVEINGVILKRNEFNSININEQDKIEILRFVGGG